MRNSRIRFAEMNDLESIVGIYNQAIQSGNVTADLDLLSIYDKIEWFHEHSLEQYPIYVMEKEETIIGWGSLSHYRKGREGLKETAEISFYIDYKYHGRGLGKQLIEFMMKDCERLRIRNLFALLLEVNKPSIKILKHFGFTQWGLMPNVVKQNGFVCGHLIYGVNL